MIKIVGYKRTCFHTMVTVYRGCKDNGVNWTSKTWMQLSVWVISVWCRSRNKKSLRKPFSSWVIWFICFFQECFDIDLVWECSFYGEPDIVWEQPKQLIGATTNLRYCHWGNDFEVIVTPCLFKARFVHLASQRRKGTQGNPEQTKVNLLNAWFWS